jgi:hypothetical protein
MNPWEKVAQGRYATTHLGHTLQAIRTSGPYRPEKRPYIAVVDRVPLDPAEWSLSRAKMKAIRFVERQNGEIKALPVLHDRPEINLPPYDQLGVLPSVTEMIKDYHALGAIERLARRYSVNGAKIRSVLDAAGALRKR